MNKQRRRSSPAAMPVEPQPMPLAQLLTIQQVANLLSIHRSTVYGLINHAGLPVMHLGKRSTRVNAARLREWIQQREEREGLVS